MGGRIDGKQEVNNAASLFPFAIRLIESFVTVLRGTPNFIFNATMNIIFGIGFNDKESETLDGRARSVSDFSTN